MTRIWKTKYHTSPTPLNRITQAKISMQGSESRPQTNLIPIDYGSLPKRSTRPPGTPVQLQPSQQLLGPSAMQRHGWRGYLTQCCAAVHPQAEASDIGIHWGYHSAHRPQKLFKWKRERLTYHKSDRGPTHRRNIKRPLSRWPSKTNWRFNLNSII